MSILFNDCNSSLTWKVLCLRELTIRSAAYEADYPIGIYKEWLMFSRYLWPAFARMMTNLLQPGLAQNRAPNQNKKRMFSGFNHDTPPDTTIAKGDCYPHSDLNKIKIIKEDCAVLTREGTSLRYLQDGLRQVIANTTYLHSLNEAAGFVDFELEFFQTDALVKDINDYFGI